ncbi:GspH/FimT family pseudopilin [Amphritea japonica]|uniref:Type II secretion system protein H n=1 Tax=Amphritea japonica ATCC BAA-1530 TaxID=1278309 RepID=A0A7R6P8A6_9GAMM|nr:GspH/FimT family pseudopilin [Amphritea japonica]BBB27729.1 type IV fimbrial biogenesis protein FimT [Amphritea japonica ATCC BAA-1530]
MKYSKEKGFSLIELMIVLSILVILLTIGVPSLVGFVRSQKLESAVQLFKDGYSQARYEAVSRQETIHICPLNNVTNRCGNNWDRGMLTFNDLNGDSQFDPAVDRLLRQSAFPEGVGIVWNQIGFLKIGASGGINKNGTFIIQVRGDSYSKRLVISPTGRIRIG